MYERSLRDKNIIIRRSVVEGFELSIQIGFVRLFSPMYCSLPGSSVHGILQGRILKWVAISFSNGSSQPRD